MCQIVGVHVVCGGSGVLDVPYGGQGLGVPLGLALGDAEITEGEAVVETGQRPFKNEPRRGVMMKTVLSGSPLRAPTSSRPSQWRKRRSVQFATRGSSPVRRQ